jgi:hypothetical protein
MPQSMLIGQKQIAPKPTLVVAMGNMPMGAM